MRYSSKTITKKINLGERERVKLLESTKFRLDLGGIIVEISFNEDHPSL